MIEITANITIEIIAICPVVNPLSTVPSLVRLPELDSSETVESSESSEASELSELSGGVMSSVTP